MRTLGARLGVQAPSLYAHISGLDEVLRLVHAHINSGIDTSALVDSRDPADLRQFAHEYRNAYREHPVAATIVVSRSINLDYALRIYGAIAHFLSSYGLPAHHVMPVMALFDSLVLGSAVEPFSEGFIGPASSYQLDHPALAEALHSVERNTIDDIGFELGLDAFMALINELSTLQRKN